jgi:Bacterial SH3 domain
MRHRWLLLWGLVLLAGCTPPMPPPPAAAPTATAEPSPTPAPPPATAVPTATPAPTPSPSPPASPSSSPTPAPERARVVGTDGQGVNLRQEPGTQELVLRSLREGAEVTIVGDERVVDGRAWRNVRDADGVTGWLVADALGPIDPSEEGPPTRPAAATPTPSPMPTPPPGPIPSPAPLPSPAPSPAPPDPAAPCRSEQIKGHATTGLYYLPTHPDYEALRERVRCFESETQARASGFQPAP